MKKKFALLTAVMFTFVFVLTACAQTPDAGTSSAQSTASHTPTAESGEMVTADLYFENGTIYTVDEQDSVVEALAVKDGKIVFVGSAADGQAYKEAAAEVVDLDGGMLMPGMIDAHIHSATPEFFDFSLTEDTDVDSVLQTIEDYVEANPDQKMYVGFGYKTSLFEGDELQKGPRKERLDEICPDKPLIVYSFDGHAVWVNSKCFEEVGITEDTEATPGGEIVRDEATGALWGTLKDTAMSMLPFIELPADRLNEALIHLHAGLNALGYTSMNTLPGNGFFPVPWEGYTRLEENGELTLRVRGAGNVSSWRIEEDLAALETLQQQYNSDLVGLIAAKLFADGVMDSESAHLIESYSDSASHYGSTMWEQEAFNETVARINEMGIQAHTHAIGDAAVRMALDGYEYAGANAPEGDWRNIITHLQLVAEEDIPRFAELDVIAVAQPYWHFKEPGYWQEIEYTTLGERAEHEYPMKSFLDNNVRLAFASDYPVTPNPDPFLAIETGVTRNLARGEDYGLPDITDMDDPQYLLWPEERLTVQQMIRGFTIDAAYAMFADDITGSLEVGKSADMIVVDQDLLTVDPLAISDTTVLATYLQGAMVYSAEQ
ncbi:amidohydrolase [Ruminococcaceae bacterium OttesenSCG-928-I18]|nr:amidohydrolase [Ruminococcaceae bacterium OttesenSCG-928-I18]